MKSALKNKNNHNQGHSEGPVAKAIETQTQKVPSDIFLWVAFGSIGASLGFQLMGKKETSNFIGQWAPTILILGLYNKLVKVAGSEGNATEDSGYEGNRDTGSKQGETDHSEPLGHAI